MKMSFSQNFWVEYFDEFKEWCKMRVRLNGSSTYYQSRYLGAALVMGNVGIAAVINEMLMHSFDGKIRLFPALPDDKTAASQTCVPSKHF